MTGKEMEQAIEFLLNHHSEVSADIRGLKEAQKKTDAQLQVLIASVNKLSQNASRREAQMEEMREANREMRGSIGELRESIAEMRESDREMRESIGEMRESIGEMRETVVGVMEEMRDGFNNLIIANEVTRNLAEQAAKLAISANQRVTKLEDRLQ